MKYYIYIILNLSRNKGYIGQTTNIKERWQTERRELERSTSFNKSNMHPIINSVKIHGIDNFAWIILEEGEVDTQQEIDSKEIQWIEELNTKAPYGYNLTNGGSSGTKGYKHTEEAKEKIRKYNLSVGKKPPSPFGKKLSEYQKSCLLKSNLNRKISDETRMKLSESHKGPRPERRGIKLSLESIRKRTETRKIKGISRSPKLYLAFGEEKSLKQWVLDSRCLVKKTSTIYTRINKYHWDIEKALTCLSKRKV